MRNPYRKSASSTTYYKKKPRLKAASDCNTDNSIKKVVSDYFDLGDIAPKFTLTGIVNKEPTKISLSDYKGKWVLLFFYGSDFTFV